MPEPKRGVRFNTRPWVSFFVTALFLVAIFFYFGVFPFGSKDILSSEAGGQFLPFLAALKNQLLQGKSLTYSFQTGMGKNFTGVFAYYLSSPLNLPAVLLPMKYLSEAVMFLLILKLSLAGAFMTWLLDTRFSDKTKMSILFGAMYGLCSFSLAFMVHTMWLDGFALLPLIILMLERFRKDPSRWWTVLLVMFLLFASGYYMGFIVGIFALAYLVALLDYEGAFEPKRTPSGETLTGLFLLAMLVAAMLCAAVWIPAGMDIFKNRDFSQPEVPDVQPAFSLQAFLSQLLLSRVAEDGKNLPFVATNLLVVSLVVLFYRNHEISVRVKKWTAVILGVGLLSFMLAPLNIFWHVFEEPARFLYRNSFLYIFGLILMAFYSYLHRRALSSRDFLFTGGVLFAMLALIEIPGNAGEYFFPHMFFSAAILFCLWAGAVRHHYAILSSISRVSGIVLAAILVVEIITLDPQGQLRDMTKWSMDHQAFVSSLEEYRALTEQIDKSSRFRVEKDGQGGPEPSLLNAYGQVSGISSDLQMANKTQNRFLKQLGYRLNNNYMRATHDYCILPSDSILGIRYIISERGEMTGLKKKASEGSLTLLENPYSAVPAVLAEEDAGAFGFYALEEETEDKDYFAFQEKWFSSLSGQDASGLYRDCDVCWETINGEEAPVTYTELKKSWKNIEEKVPDSLNLEDPEADFKVVRSYLRANAASPMSIRTTIVADSTDMLYLSVPFMMESYPFSVYCNGQKVFEETSDSDYSVLVNLGNFSVGEEVLIEVRTEEEVFPCFDLKLAYVDTAVLDAQMKILKDGISDARIENGEVAFTAEADARRLVVTSIPYEKGWRVTIDGTPCDVLCYQEAFVSFYMDAGNHQVKMEFSLPGGSIGVIISAVGLLSGTAFAILLKRRYSSSGSDKKVTGDTK